MAEIRRGDGCNAYNRVVVFGRIDEDTLGDGKARGDEWKAQAQARTGFEEVLYAMRRGNMKEKTRIQDSIPLYLKQPRIRREDINIINKRKHQNPH